MKTTTVENKVVTYQLIMEILEDLRVSVLNSPIGKEEGIENQPISKNVLNIYEVLAELKNKDVQKIEAEDYIEIFKNVISGLSKIKIKATPFDNQRNIVDMTNWRSNYGGLNLFIEFTLKDVYIGIKIYDELETF